MIWLHRKQPYSCRVVDMSELALVNINDHLHIVFWPRYRKSLRRQKVLHFFKKPVASCKASNKDDVLQAGQYVISKRCEGKMLTDIFSFAEFF